MNIAYVYVHGLYYALNLVIELMIDVSWFYDNMRAGNESCVYKVNEAIVM